MHNKIIEKSKINKNNSEKSNAISEFTNKLIHRVTNNLEKFNYNVVVASFYETYNFINKQLDQNLNEENLLDNYRKILYLMSPLIPHFSYECLEKINDKSIKNWPKANIKFLTSSKNIIVVQINGKKKHIIEATKDITESNLLKQINNEDKLKKILENKDIIKSIYIKNKLINLIIKS